MSTLLFELVKKILMVLVLLTSFSIPAFGADIEFGTTEMEGYCFALSRVCESDEECTNWEPAPIPFVDCDEADAYIADMVIRLEKIKELMKPPPPLKSIPEFEREKKANKFPKFYI